MKCSHGAKPPTVEPAALAGNDHEDGNQGQHNKPEHGIVIATDDDHGQQDGHKQLALLSTANLFYFCFSLYFSFCHISLILLRHIIQAAKKRPVFAKHLFASNHRQMQGGVFFAWLRPAISIVVCQHGLALTGPANGDYLFMI